MHNNTHPYLEKMVQCDVRPQTIRETNTEEQCLTLPQNCHCFTNMSTPYC